jgi:hypothetical protein
MIMHQTHSPECLYALSELMSRFTEGYGLTMGRGMNQTEETCVTILCECERIHIQFVMHTQITHSDSGVFHMENKPPYVLSKMIH